MRGCVVRCGMCVQYTHAYVVVDGRVKVGMYALHVNIDKDEQNCSG